MSTNQQPEFAGPALRKREGDQPLPTPNDSQPIHDLVGFDLLQRSSLGDDALMFVVGDINDRKALGTRRYGTPLQAFNGRDAMRDHYEELLDAACYARQIVDEEPRVDHAFRAHYERLLDACVMVRGLILARDGR